MAKKPTEKQLYKLKNEWLGQFFEEVKPKEFSSPFLRGQKCAINCIDNISPL